MEHWLPLFEERLETIFDYVPDAAISFDERDDFLREERWELVMARYHARAQSAKDLPRSEVFAPPCRPELLYLSPDAFERTLAGKRIYRIRSAKLPPGPGIVDMGGVRGFEFSASSDGQNQETQLERFAGKIQELSKDSNVVVACWTKGSRDRLASLLEDSGIDDIRRIDCARDLGGPHGKVCGVVLGA